MTSLIWASVIPWTLSSAIFACDTICGPAGHAGLVNVIVPAAELEAHTLKAARRLAAKPPGALAAARKLMRGDPAELLAQIGREGAVFAERLKSPEAKEAFAAFMEKRPPDFARFRQAG